MNAYDLQLKQNPEATQITSIFQAYVCHVELGFVRAYKMSVHEQNKKLQYYKREK